MAKDVTRQEQQVNGTLVSRLPTDLARVAGKGLAAMEAFLDLRGEERVSAERHARARDFAVTGSQAVGYGIRYMQAANNAEAIALARERFRSQSA